MTNRHSNMGQSENIYLQPEVIKVRFIGFLCQHQKWFTVIIAIIQYHQEIIKPYSLQEIYQTIAISNYPAFFHSDSHWIAINNMHTRKSRDQCYGWRWHLNQETDFQPSPSALESRGYIMVIQVEDWCLLERAEFTWCNMYQERSFTEGSLSANGTNSHPVKWGHPWIIKCMQCSDIRGNWCGLDVGQCNMCSCVLTSYRNGLTLNSGW